MQSAPKGTSFASQNAELNEKLSKGSFRGRELAPKVTEGLVCKEMNHIQSPFYKCRVQNAELLTSKQAFSSGGTQINQHGVLIYQVIN